MTVPTSSRFVPGQLVPGTPYEVLGLVGTGGMGSVYDVVHSVLGRRFVLKVLHGQLKARQDLVQRMATEWRTLGQLNHKNIVTVTDAGYTSDQIPYYVMERLEGETLHDRLKREGQFEARYAATLVIGILEGLGRAHELGAIHRDIKPQNIFLSEGVAKLLDFGIAKVLDGSNRVVTAAGLTIGTPRYMSPEQAAGKPVDGRSDIYSTALVLYEMVAGRGPFSHVKEPHELVLAHITEEPARVDWVVPGLPEHFADLLHRWLAKAPGSRPPTADVAARELQALLMTLPTEVLESTQVTLGGAHEAETVGPDAPRVSGAPPVRETPVRETANPTPSVEKRSRASRPVAESGRVRSAPAALAFAPTAAAPTATVDDGRGKAPQTVKVGTRDDAQTRSALVVPRQKDRSSQGALSSPVPARPDGRRRAFVVVTTAVIVSTLTAWFVSRWSASFSGAPWGREAGTAPASSPVTTDRALQAVETPPSATGTSNFAPAPPASSAADAVVATSRAVPEQPVTAPLAPSALPEEVHPSTATSTVKAAPQGTALPRKDTRSTSIQQTTAQQEPAPVAPPSTPRPSAKALPPAPSSSAATSTRSEALPSPWGDPVPSPAKAPTLPDSGL